jgi:hypothetical protein
MPFINCTPHPIFIIKKNGEKLELHKGTMVPRIETRQTKVSEFEDVEIFKTEFGGITNLPPVIDGVFYIVSRMVLDAAPLSRQDLLAPGDLVRDCAGNIIGCKGLSM